MPRDTFGLEISAANQPAVAAYNELVNAYLGFRRDTGEHLKAALAADTNLVMGHVLKGYFYLLFCSPHMDGRVAKTIGLADVAASTVRAGERERRHIDALRAWAARDIAGATALWEEILLAWPRDILALRLAHFTHFYLGDSRNLRDSIARVMHAWDDAAPGYAYLLGMWAFGLEECGDYVRAEMAGRRAVAKDPANIWAVHAVAHVMEMQGRHREGIEWLTETEPAWAECNNFAYHVWWHRALFHLERGENEAVLDHYDQKFRADVDSEDYLDMSNAIAMLWRLENADVDIGARWSELGEKAEKRADDNIFVFIDAHLAMALAASGREQSAARLIETMSTAATTDATEALIYCDVGIPLCEAMLAYRAGDYALAVDRLLPIRYDVVRIGGSHAQRDVFHQTLIEAALKDKRYPLARALLAERVAERADSAHSWARYADSLDGVGNSEAAMTARTRSTQILSR